MYVCFICFILWWIENGDIVCRFICTCVCQMLLQWVAKKSTCTWILLFLQDQVLCGICQCPELIPPPSISVSLLPLIIMGLLTVTLFTSIMHWIVQIISQSSLITLVPPQTGFPQFQLDYVSSSGYCSLWCLSFSLVQYLDTNLHPLNVAECIPYYIIVYAENQVGRGLETQGINFTMPCSKECMKYIHVHVQDTM